MKTLKLVCMAFDGANITETTGSDIQSLWEHSNDMGSKWFFYPFHFVCTDKTVKDAPGLYDWTIGKRIKTVQRLFKQASERPELKGADCDEYLFYLLAKMQG